MRSRAEKSGFDESRLGLKGDIRAGSGHVRFTPESRHSALSATIISNESIADFTPISAGDGAAGNWCSRIDAGCHRH
jgi:hypothetical protein